MTRCKVLIVGGGPAGLSAASHLSRLGIGDVVVLERLSDAPYRRYHSICGEAVSDRYLRLSGTDPGEVVCRVSELRIVREGAKDIPIPVKGQIIDRNAMLDGLRSGCGARIERGTAVRIAENGDGTYTVSASDGSEYVCDWLVGADGTHSTVRRTVFGSSPEEYVPIVNNVVAGESDGALRFIIGEGLKGGYAWEFPSKPGTMSKGYIKGAGDITEFIETGARDMPLGKLPAVVKGRCVLAGDAGCLANQFCFGGIGIALLSGRRAAEAIAKGDLAPYAKWVARDRAFDPRFLEAHRIFTGWSDADMEVAMRPFEGGYSIARGAYAMILHPGWTKIYMACWLGFRKGW